MPGIRPKTSLRAPDLHHEVRVAWDYAPGSRYDSHASDRSHAHVLLSKGALVHPIDDLGGRYQGIRATFIRVAPAWLARPITLTQ